MFLKKYIKGKNFTLVYYESKLRKFNTSFLSIPGSTSLFPLLKFVFDLCYGR